MAQDYFNGAPYPGTPNNNGVNVSISSALFLAANNSRERLVITNTGSNPVYLALGANATAVVGQGIYIAPNGGAFVLDSALKWQGAIQAIASGGSSVVTFTEI
jgi:hypothetical protein